jgi:hypothetical protein
MKRVKRFYSDFKQNTQHFKRCERTAESFGTLLDWYLGRLDRKPKHY